MEVYSLLTIDLGVVEEYDNDKNEFVYHTGGIVRFEYSLKAIYEWEGKWKKPFLTSELTDDEYLDFYKTMALDPIDDLFLTHTVVREIAKYVSEAHTATSFASTVPQASGKNRSGKFLTSEEIYANMFSAGVAIEFEERNFNRLLTILKIISLHNEPPKKMAKQDVLKQNASLNEQRKAMLNTKG